jgi:protein-tyrosine phosphatase
MTDSLRDSLINGENGSQNVNNEFYKFIDIHCHCLPGLDDGPSTMKESIALCRMLAAEGITTVVATPHQLGRFEGFNEASNVRGSVKTLNELLEKNAIPAKILPGGEVRVDERICNLLATDRILTLADGGKYLLIELPHGVFIDIEPLLMELASMDVQPIISHAERMVSVSANSRLISNWLDRSAHLQITASGLLGDFGPEAQRIAWDFLSSGKAALVATDSHNTDSRKPKMKTAFRRISDKLSEDLAYLVCIENPKRVIIGEEILPVSLCNQKEADR